MPDSKDSPTFTEQNWEAYVHVCVSALQTVLGEDWETRVITQVVKDRMATDPANADFIRKRAIAFSISTLPAKLSEAETDRLEGAFTEGLRSQFPESYQDGRAPMITLPQSPQDFKK